MELLQGQFRDVKEWRGALRKRGLTPGSVRRMMADDLRAVQWFLQQIDSQVQTTAEECRAYYQAHPESFSQPARFRASHLFLAAPPETPPEIVDQKREKIEALSKRIAAGEDFFELIAVESEDEETKARGGDLGFFSASRMPADFFSAVAKMEVGRISPPVRTRLGFHIVELTNLRPSRQLGFEEVEPEIALRIQNEKRQRLTPGFAAKLADAAEFLRALR
jgi:parvulin-like peptidyl-prolyl isomerase